MQESPQVPVDRGAGRPVRASANAVLAIVAVAQFMVVLDASVVNVALPSIQRDVGFSEQSLSWVLNAYTLLFGGFLLLGGAIVQVLSWRWVFFVNVPIGAAVLLLSPRILPESRGEGVRGGYDLEGAAAITLGTMTLVFTLIKANEWGWGSARTLGGLAVAAALLAGFLWIERRHENPLVPLRIFSNRSLAAADATMLLLAAALFGVFFFCSLYLQQVLGYNALKTGVAYLPLSLTVIGSSALASRVLDRFTPKPVLVAGLLVATVGFVLFTRLQAHGDYPGQVLPAMLVMGVGFGMAFVPITIAATSGDAAEDSGLASGLLNTTQQVGGSLGLAVLSAVSTSRITSSLEGGSTQAAALTPR